MDAPADWSLIQWHVAPDSRRYRSRETASRACRWLNANAGTHDAWLFRPGPVVGGRVLLERRWVGHSDGVVGDD
jgi:hypothetical protein